MNAYFNDIVKNLAQLIRFPSFEQPPKEGAPFGDGVKRCLEYFLTLADFLGFETKNYDGYIGEVDFGEGKDFAVLCHLDVVPAGNGWTVAPFGGKVDNERKRIWGRGAMDDKGAAMICLYAMNALKDEGFKPKRKIKLIVGCNEETGWKCIEHYNKVAKMPEEGFSPDADFPVIYAEKGILHLQFELPADGADFSGLKGGERANMVCDLCEVETDKEIDPALFPTLSRHGNKVISRGVSAHGSTPEKGENAIAPMLRFLGLEREYALFFEEKFSLADMRDETRTLSFSPDVIEQRDGKIFITCDIRYPATKDKDDVLKRIERYGVPYRILHDQPPIYNDKECRLIKTLSGVYKEVTGKDATPIAIGGGTYARALKCGAAFGPEETGEESTIHQPDEYITFEKIDRCFEIYKLALKRLTE